MYYVADTADPLEPRYDDKCFKARCIATAQNFRVGHFRLPLHPLPEPDPYYSTLAVDIELVNATYMTPIFGPRLAAIQQGGNDYSLVDCNFCARAHTTFVSEAPLLFRMHQSPRDIIVICRPVVKNLPHGRGKGYKSEVVLLHNTS